MISENILKPGYWLSYKELSNDYRTFIRIDNYSDDNSSTMVQIYGPVVHIGHYDKYNDGIILTGIDCKNDYVSLSKFSLELRKYLNYLISNDDMKTVILKASANLTKHYLEYINN